jgi:hypothetical protein
MPHIGKKTPKSRILKRRKNEADTLEIDLGIGPTNGGRRHANFGFGPK